VTKKPVSQSNTLPQLGELELALLESLWRTPQQSAQQLQQALPRIRQSSLSTVQSTLERLHRKTLVQRHKQGHAYVYCARLGRAELLGKLLGGVIRQLHTGSLDPILSSFVEFADKIDEQTLERLDQLVQQRRLARLEDG
jgi:predicted transcriptional regulator